MGKIKQNHFFLFQKFNIFAWTTSLAAMIMVKLVNAELQQIDSSYTPFTYGLYEALSHVIWSIVLCYIIFACIHGSGGPINWFLSNEIWQPINRLSFAIFMVHPTVITMTLSSIQSAQFISKLTLFSIVLVNLLLTFFAAFLLTLAFDSPIINIEKLILGSNVRIELPCIQKQNGTEQIVHIKPSEKIEKKRS